MGVSFNYEIPWAKNSRGKLCLQTSESIIVNTPVANIKSMSGRTKVRLDIIHVHHFCVRQDNTYTKYCIVMSLITHDFITKRYK